jgi:hypothetical protein
MDPRRDAGLFDLACHVLEGTGIDPPGAVPDHVIVDIVRDGEDQVRPRVREALLHDGGVQDARGGDHRLSGQPFGVLPDRPDMQGRPELDQHHLAGPAVVLPQPGRQFRDQRVDHAKRGDGGRHHDHRAVAAVLVVAAVPRHTGGLERRSQDLIQRRPHDLTIGVKAQGIPETGDVGEQDRAVQRLTGGAEPPRGQLRGSLTRNLLAAQAGGWRLAVSRAAAGDRACTLRYRVADRGQPVQVDHGQPA